ncbi:MAG TPA: YdcF family protein [Bacteroidia bacterium]|nr:YdcF family protein [Bacteroidia bacterium]
MGVRGRIRGPRVRNAGLAAIRISRQAKNGRGDHRSRCRSGRRPSGRSPHGADGDRPSPVYEARLRHAVELHRAGVAPILIFTGGKGKGDLLVEGEVGRNYALAKGVPASAILIETRSRTTLENLKEARALIEAAAISEDIAIVSDPHHLLRAGWMAHGTGMRVWSSPTPYSRYRSASTRIPAILREVYFLHHYALFRQ